jgi:hypothetical protein
MQANRPEYLSCICCKRRQPLTGVRAFQADDEFQHISAVSQWTSALGQHVKSLDPYRSSIVRIVESTWKRFANVRLRQSIASGGRF